jgi:hypothetical protein
MFQSFSKTTTFEDFREWKPDGILYELEDRVIVERQPIGEHQEITADFTLMKYTRQALDRCRETALPCPLSLLCTSLT